MSVMRVSRGLLGDLSRARRSKNPSPAGRDLSCKGLLTEPPGTAAARPLLTRSCAPSWGEASYVVLEACLGVLHELEGLGSGIEPVPCPT